MRIAGMVLLVLSLIVGSLSFAEGPTNAEEVYSLNIIVAQSTDQVAQGTGQVAQRTGSM
jgi:hypothetical protein